MSGQVHHTNPGSASAAAAMAAVSASTTLTPRVGSAASAALESCVDDGIVVPSRRVLQDGNSPQPDLQTPAHFKTIKHLSKAYLPAYSQTHVTTLKARLNLHLANLINGFEAEELEPFPYKVLPAMPSIHRTIDLIKALDESNHIAVLALLKQEISKLTFGRHVIDHGHAVEFARQVLESVYLHDEIEEDERLKAQLMEDVYLAYPYWHQPPCSKNNIIWAYYKANPSHKKMVDDIRIGMGKTLPKPLLTNVIFEAIPDEYKLIYLCQQSTSKEFSHWIATYQLDTKLQTELTALQDIIELCDKPKNFAPDRRSYRPDHRCDFYPRGFTKQEILRALLFKDMTLPEEFEIDKFTDPALVKVAIHHLHERSALLPSQFNDTERRFMSSCFIAESFHLVEWRCPTFEIQYSKAPFLIPNIERAKYIKSLKLNKVGLLAIPPSLVYCTNLEEVQLSDNAIKSVPSELFSLPKLTHLKIERNQLHILPDDIGYATHMQSCALSGNQIEVLPPTIGQCLALKYLIMGENCLSALPVELFNCIELKSLVFVDNKLSIIPDQIGMCKKLELLSLDRNQIATLPNALSKCQTLQEIHLRSNPIESLPFESLALIQSLLLLNLYKCKVKDKPEIMADLEKLAASLQRRLYGFRYQT